MKRIVMNKYGFIRRESEDFTDDSNRFTGYTISSNSRLRVTKLVSDGRAYLSCDMNGNKLDYTEYSKLPHYQCAWDYNGVDLDKLTEADLIDFYNACVAYEKEYLEAEAKVTFPSIEDIKLQCETINAIRKAEIDEVSILLERVAVNFIINGTSDYELKEVRRYFKTLKERFFDVDKYPQSVQKTNYGRNFVKPTNPDLKPSFYYTQLIEILEKYL